MNQEKINALIIKGEDSVAVVIEPLAAGSRGYYKVGDEIRSITACEDIPVYHKIALLTIAKGTDVFKYGASIGQAITDIQAGQHVHTHNIISIRETIAK